MIGDTAERTAQYGGGGSGGGCDYGVIGGAEVVVVEEGECHLGDA